MSLSNNHFGMIDQPSERRVYSVSELTREVKQMLEGHFPPLWIEGEISNFKRHSSGHFYFSLKDADAQIGCVMWRGRNQTLIFRPEDGMKVTAMGNVTVYERQGRYQLDVMFLQPAGVGELQLAFERLKKRLHAEGLFDSSYKQKIPDFPQRIGVVTSPTGAAFQDIVSVIRRRFPAVQIVLYPARVQGVGAAEEIARGIADLNASDQVDVIIVGRGGGSLEDLWAFNEEIVARAIFSSHLPVISAVGHEIDFSISDFVADLRAPTPSAAAELVVRDRDELRQILFHRGTGMWKHLRRRIEIGRERVNALKGRYAFRLPENLLRENRQRLDDLRSIMQRGYQYRLENAYSKVTELQSRLNALNPEAVLERGYSITTRIPDGSVIRTVQQVEIDTPVKIRFSKGAVKAVVKNVEDE